MKISNKPCAREAYCRERTRTSKRHCVQLGCCRQAIEPVKRVIRRYRAHDFGLMITTRYVAVIPANHLVKDAAKTRVLRGVYG